MRRIDSSLAVVMVEKRGKGSRIVGESEEFKITVFSSMFSEFRGEEEKRCEKMVEEPGRDSSSNTMDVLGNGLQILRKIVLALRRKIPPHNTKLDMIEF